MSLAMVNWDVFKVPLGFVRVVQLPLVVIAFACAMNSGFYAKYSVACNPAQGKEHAKEVYCGYPYSLDSKLYKSYCNGTDEGMTLWSQGHRSSAQFFVFVGWMTFFFILFSAYIYGMRWESYEQDPRYAKADLVITAVLVFCWVCGWIAWAAATTSIRNACSKDVMMEQVKHRDGSCINASPPCVVSLNPDGHWNFSQIIISAVRTRHIPTYRRNGKWCLLKLAGFGVCVALIGNLWFVYKETEWFKLRQSKTDMNQIPGQTISGASTPGAPPDRSFPGGTY